MPNKFKVGDYIFGTSRGVYGVTDSDMTKAQVIIVYDDEQILIKALEHSSKYHQHNIGEDFSVLSKYFDLIEPKNKLLIDIF